MAAEVFNGGRLAFPASPDPDPLPLSGDSSPEFGVVEFDSSKPVDVELS